MKRLYLLMLFIILLLTSCKVKNHEESNKKNITETAFSWANDAVAYEVNIRQFTPEGTFNSFAQHLPRLKKLGVEILWLMPVQLIGEKNRKGSLGSYYSIKDFRAINPEFGTMNDFKSLVTKAHQMGFKLLIDFAPKVSAWDNDWIEKHPNWIMKDSLGNAATPDELQFDVVDLNYNDLDLRSEMIDVMKFWVGEVGIDGFRCDGSETIPTEFWIKAREELKKIKPVFLISDYKNLKEIPKNIFNCNFDWETNSLMTEIYNGNKSVVEIRHHLKTINDLFPEDNFPFQLTSYHDFNSWAGTDQERFGDSFKAFVVLSFTVPGMPLIFNGQEVGLNKRFEFFEKDEIDWNIDPSMSDFYKKLIDLKKKNSSLWNGKAGGLIEFLDTSDDEKILAYKRKNGNSIVFVILNLSNEERDINFLTSQINNPMIEYFSQNKTTFDENLNLEIKPWEYFIYELSE